MDVVLKLIQGGETNLGPLTGGEGKQPVKDG
jgi:hypothetical protein